MPKINRPKKKVIPRKKILLDTSTQIDRIISRSVREKLDSFRSNHNLYTSPYVLYEFRTGLIKALIEYYFKIKLAETIADGIDLWGQSFKIRDFKYKGLLESLMFRMYDSINTKDKDEYLAKVEAIILYLLDNFLNGLRGMYGDFGEDTIIKFPIKSKVDFNLFLEQYKKRPCIPQRDFWSKHRKELCLLVKNHSLFKSDALKKIYNYLVEIERDIKNCEKYHHNRGVGDAVISIDPDKSFIIGSSDYSIETMCQIMGREFYKITK